MNKQSKALLVPKSPPLCGLSPVLNNIIENPWVFSIDGHVYVNICNKPSKCSNPEGFKKSIMSNHAL